MTHDITNIDKEYRKQVAAFIETMIADYENPERRMMIAIVAHTVRRGKRLTATEQLANLHAALHAEDPDNYEVPFP